MINVVAAIVIRGRKVLIARRAPHKSLAGKWEFPGGKIECQESPQTALERELYEEFKVKTRTGEYLGSNTHYYDNFAIHLSAYISEYLSGTWMPSDHDQIKWVDCTNLLDYELAEADIPFVNMIKERLC